MASDCSNTGGVKYHDHAKKKWFNDQQIAMIIVMISDDHGHSGYNYSYRKNHHYQHGESSLESFACDLVWDLGIIDVCLLLWCFHCSMLLTLCQFNIAIENGHVYWVFPLRMVIFHSYVELPKLRFKSGLNQPQCNDEWFWIVVWLVKRISCRFMSGFQA